MEKQNHTNSGGEPSNYKVKLMCSYGGKIQSRPHDHQLTYVGGDTKIMTVDRNIKFCDIVAKLNSMCNCNAQICLKYQLPGQDLDALVSLIDDDDLEHMMVEYELIDRISTKPARLRLFLFSLSLPMVSGPDELRNLCATPGTPLIPDFLFGFDKEYNIDSKPSSELELPQTPVTTVPGNPKSDPLYGAEMWTQKQVQEIAGESLVSLMEVYSRDSNVTSEAYAFPAPLVYRLPVPAGPNGEQLRAVACITNGEQPVYNFLPLMDFSAQAQKIPIGAHVAVNQREGFVGHDAAGPGCLYPTVKMGDTLNHESKVPQPT